MTSSDNARIQYSGYYANQFVEFLNEVAREKKFKLSLLCIEGNFSLLFEIYFSELLQILDYDTEKLYQVLIRVPPLKKLTMILGDGINFSHLLK